MPIVRGPIRSIEPRSTWRYRVLRANEHLATLRAHVEWFKQVRAYEPLTEHDTETGKHRIVVNSVPTLPLELSMVVGDVSHNLRLFRIALGCGGDSCITWSAA